MYLKLFLFALAIVAIAMLGIGIKLLLTKKETIPAMGCKAASNLSEKNVGCACSADDSQGCGS
jgi:hypothetical protein